MANHILLPFAAAGILAFAAGAALGQKAKDTLRIGVRDSPSSILVYDDPQPEAGVIGRAVFEPLVDIDRSSGKVQPLLATSWSWPNDRTLELKLRDDVKFHDGSPFDADDVVYTLNYLVDPKVNLRFKANYDWIERAERVDRYTVRILLKHPSPLALLRLGVTLSVLPSDLHSKYAQAGDFGRKTPVGTGPYKVELMDLNRGVILVRDPGHRHGASPASIGRVHFVPIADEQTQIAQLMTGGLDLVRVENKDQSDLLRATPGLAVTATQGQSYIYLSMDAVNRSGNKALADERVRRALVQALDRETLAKSVLAGDEEVKAIDALCFRFQQGCDFSTRPAPFDRAAAKTLLAQAGYANGFDVEITATPGQKQIAEAIAGELRKVGVRAKVEPLTFAAYRKKQRDGKLQLLVSVWTSGGMPDASATTDFFFSGGPRDYWRDPAITRLHEQGLATLDEAKRRSLYRKAFDIANAKSYVMPLSTRPTVLAHARDLEIDKGSLGPSGFELHRTRWK